MARYRLYLRVGELKILISDHWWQWTARYAARTYWEVDQVQILDLKTREWVQT